jgi:hypothetical protein
LALSIPRRRYFPCWKTRSISRLARNRTELEGYGAGCLTSRISWPFPRRPFGFGPSCAGALTPFGPPWFSCGRENRVSFSACGCLVETFFSYFKPNPIFPPRLIGYSNPQLPHIFHTVSTGGFPKSVRVWPGNKIRGPFKTLWEKNFPPAFCIGRAVRPWRCKYRGGK